MSRYLSRAVLFAALVACSVGAHAEEPAPGSAKVMMLGVFHFANPGRDVVKSEVIDVTTAENQAYLEGLAERIAAFDPTDVLVECVPARQPQHDAAYAAWRDGTAPLDVNETQQIGFRVAKAAGLDGVTCFDEGDVHWNGKPLFDHLAAHEPERKAQLDAMFASISERTTLEQTTLSLPALLKLSNDAERDRENKDFYIGTNAVGAGAGLAGADASAGWWHRNFRMYANVQKAAAPGRRVLVMAGYGHTAILKDLLAIDGQREAMDVVSVPDALTACAPHARILTTRTRPDQPVARRHEDADDGPDEARPDS